MIKKSLNKMPNYYPIAMGLGLVLCLLFWVSEALFHVYLLHSGTFLSQLIPTDKNELWMRFVILMLILLCSFIIGFFLKQKIFFSHKLTITYQILNAIGNAALITDSQNKIIFINRHYSQITGYTLDEVFGKNPNILSSGKQDKTFYKKLWRSLTTLGYWEGEIWNRKKSGELFPEWINISVIKDQNNKTLYYIGIFSDISFKKVAEDKMMHYAYYDPLTNLPNRRFFIEQTKQSIAIAKRNNQKLSILFLDLDGFKQINDQFGHSIGDLFLCEIAHLLKSNLRESDFIARLGGDEFVLLLSDVESKAATYKFCDELIYKLEASSILINNNNFSVKASVGCAVYPDDGVDVESLIHFADTKMYTIKSIRQKASKDNL